MKMLSFALIALVGTMILGFPLQSYADPQLDTLLSIATQARDNLSLTISQTNNIPDEINQLFKQGSDETDQLAKAVAQQDVQSAKQHFLAAMKFFKATNDKINSLNVTTSNDQQRAQIAQLRGEIIRLERMETLLKTIATKNNIDIDFTKFDQLIQTIQQDLDSGNIDDAKTTINDANNFLVETHHSLTSIAQERSSERAKDFTEKQIERFSNMKEINPPQNLSPSVTAPTTNATTLTTAPTTNVTAPLTNATIPTPPTNVTTTAPTTNATAPLTNATIPTPTNVTAPTPVPQSTTLAANSTVTEKSPEQMLAELKKLVSEGKVDEALKVIKKIEAYQREKLRNTEKEGQFPSNTNASNVTGSITNNTSTPPQTIPSITPPSTMPTNETGINTTSSTTIPTPPLSTSPTSPSTTIHGDHEKHNPEGNHDGRQHKENNPQDSTSQHD